MPGAAGTFGGELGLVSLFDVAQLLLLNRATGRLEIDSGEFSGSLIFRDGRIVNATDEQHREGEAVAYRIFGWKTGRFDFSPEPVGPTGSIEDGTEALMLEAARRQDEAASTPGEGGAEARVREHQGALEALRDVFRDVTTETRRFGVPVPNAPGQTPEALGLACDRMVLRPGRPARMRVAGEWREARDAPLSVSEYEEFKNRLLGPGAQKPAGEHDPSPRFATLNDRRNVAVALVASGTRESLWLRPVDLPAPGPERLEGAGDHLKLALTTRPALILIGGADADAVSELMCALVETLARIPHESLLLASELPVYAHGEQASVLAECAPREFAAALAASRPCTLALDLDHPLPESSLQGLGAVTRLLVAVPSRDAAEARARWKSLFAPVDRERVEAQVAQWPAFLVMANASRTGGETIPYSVWKIEGDGWGTAAAGKAAGSPELDSEPGSRAA